MITEVAKVNIKLASIITAMPIITILSILWMYYEGIPNEKIGSYVFNTLMYIIPTMPMFLLFPYILERTNFCITLIISLTLVGFFALFGSYWLIQIIEIIFNLNIV